MNVVNTYISSPPSLPTSVALNFYGLIKTFKKTINVSSFLIFQKMELTSVTTFWQWLESPLLEILKAEVSFVTKYKT